MTAEELAPFLDPPSGRGERSPLDESFVVPALVRFAGHPEVDARGELLYTFPELQTTSGVRVRCISRAPSSRAQARAWSRRFCGSQGCRLGAFLLEFACSLSVPALSRFFIRNFAPGWVQCLAKWPFNPSLDRLPDQFARLLMGACAAHASAWPRRQLGRRR